MYRMYRAQAGSNFLAISIFVSAVIIAGSIIWAVRSFQNYISNFSRSIFQPVPTAQRPQPPGAQQPGAQPIGQQNQPPAQPPEDTVDLSQVDQVPQYRIKGNPKAKVTIIEYSDFQCPFCARFTQTTLQQITQEYGDKVKIVFKHMPLPFHQYAQKAGEAAECAGKIGGAKAFWAMHDKLFYEGQPTGRLDIASIKKFSKDIGLDEKRFSQCLESGETAEIVQKDFLEAQRVGVRGTPTFFINNRVIRGALPFQAFKEVIDRELGS